MSASSRFSARHLLLSAIAAPAIAFSAVSGATLLCSTSAYAQEAALPIIVSDAQARQLIASGAKIIDLRQPADYEKGHIKGAINLPWRKLNQREIDGIRNEFAEDSVFEKELAAAGLSYDDTLLIYETNALPGRAFVALDYAGFGGKLHVLDGGIGAWKEPLSTEPVTTTPTAFKLDRKNEMRVTKDYVASKIGARDAVIVDGRDEEAYIDGHIPGAKGLPAATLLTPQKTLKPEATLTKLVTDTGLAPDKEIVSYCGSGVYAANNYLALRNLGYKNVVFYDASWDEWSRDPKAGQELSLANYAFDVKPVATTQTVDGIPVVAKADGRPRFIDIEELKLASSDSNTVILDVRSPADYDWGHIPGSVNVFWNDTLNSNRTLKDGVALAKIYDDAGITPDKRVVVYARGGYQLSHAYTVLALLGYDKVDFFTGKFEGWKSK